MLGLGAAALLGALSPAPDAPTPGIPIEWSAPSQCPAPSQVQRWLTDALADSAADPAGIMARVEIAAVPGGFQLELALDRPEGPVGRRTMNAIDCHALATAAVLIIALTVDPQAKVEVSELGKEPEPEPEFPEPVPVVPVVTVEPEPEPEPEPAPKQEPALEPEPSEPSRSGPADASPVGEPRVHVSLRASGAAGLLVLSGPTAVLSLTALLHGPHFRTELGASYWTPVEARAPDGAGGRLQQWTVDARGCGVLQPGPLEVPLCGGFDIGAVHGQGLDVLDPQRVTSLRLAFTAGAALIWRPARLGGRLGLWAGGDLLVALVRARFRATPAATALVYHTPPVGTRLGFGVEVRFR